MESINTADYQIHIAPIAEGVAKLEQLHQYPNVFVIVDENTKRHCLPQLQNALSGIPLQVIEIPSGEVHKNVQTCTAIWQAMMGGAAGRRDLTINLGGGVIGDMGGFCASTFKRGMDFVQIPTTLLSQVDASIGGKLGIDFQSVKNSIGLFKNPRAVLIDTGFLKTLPPDELRSGFAEMIKHSLIADSEQWEILSRITAVTMDNVVPLLPASLQIKKTVVEADPFEKGWRKTLNFGHTVGHAVESMALETPYPLLHGEAIAIGMVCESYLSYLQSGLAKTDLEKITRFILAIYGKVTLDADAFPTMLRLMRQDKKNDDRRINFTMLNAPGKALINQFVAEETIVESLAYYQNS